MQSATLFWIAWELTTVVAVISYSHQGAVTGTSLLPSETDLKLFINGGAGHPHRPQIEQDYLLIQSSVLLNPADATKDGKR